MITLKKLEATRKAMIEKLCVWAFLVSLVAFSLRMTWVAAYAQGRDSVWNTQQQAADLQANCYALDGDCSDKPKHRGTK